MHGLLAERGGGVLDQGDVVPEFHAKAAGRLDAGAGDHADQHDAADAVLLELQIEIGVAKPLVPRIGTWIKEIFFA